MICLIGIYFAILIFLGKTQVIKSTLIYVVLFLSSFCLGIFTSNYIISTSIDGNMYVEKIPHSVSTSSGIDPNDQDKKHELEQLKVSYDCYHKYSENNCQFSTLTVSTDNTKQIYKLEYNLPSIDTKLGEVSSNISISFSDTQDISKYKYLAFEVKRNKMDTNPVIGISDAKGKYLWKYIKDKMDLDKIDSQPIKIKLIEFEKPSDFLDTEVKNIYFRGTSNAGESGQHSFEIKNIYFARN